MALISFQPNTMPSAVIWRLALNSVGFCIAVLVSSAIAVTSLSFFDLFTSKAPELDMLGSFVSLSGNWPGLMLGACVYTSIMALPPAILFLTAFELIGQKEKAVYMFTGGATAMLAHVLFSIILSINTFNMPHLIIASLFGGVSGGYALWKVVR